MQQVMARVTGIRVYHALSGFALLRLTALPLAANLQPGQFIHVDVEAAYVRRPMFPVALYDDGFDLLLPPNHPLRRLGPAAGLDCIGPLGKGFPLPPSARNLLLVIQSRGFGVAAQQHGVTFVLTLIDRALATRRKVLLVHEAPTAEHLFPISALPPSVEVRLATADCSHSPADCSHSPTDGAHSPATSALDLLPELALWADQVYAVGHVAWYAALVDALRQHRLRLSQGLVWGLIAPEVMPCGMGVCGGCAVETRRGYRSPCVDGPVFDLAQV